MQPLLVENLTVQMGKNTLLHDISFAVAPGRIIGLIGLNGAGKTTLLKTLVGLRQAQSGSIRIFGEAPAHKNTRNYLAYLPEKFMPALQQNGHEFLHALAALRAQKLSADDIAQCLQALQLDPTALAKKLQHYSKGMLQKLIFASVALCRAPLWLLDEPLDGLDPVARQLLHQLLKRHKAQGGSIILSTHLLAEVESLIDDVLIMHQGRLLAATDMASFCRTQNKQKLDDAFLQKITG